MNWPSPPKYRTVRLVVDVTVFDDSPDTYLQEPKFDMEDRLFNRVVDAILPHPDSRIATSKSGESVTVLMTGAEVTS